MKLILVRIGKAFNVIKRDGFFKGIKRVISSFFLLFRRVGEGDILFVTNGVGDSALYRTHHVSEELELHGFKCSVTVQDNPFLLKYVKKFKVFIFHRTLYTGKIKNFVEEIKKQKKEIIFETDDLTYDRKYLDQMEFFKEMNPLEKKLYENGLGGEILNDPYVKTCTTTTTYLAGNLREKDKRVFIVPNKLSNKDLEIVSRVEKSKNDIVKLGYFSGSSSHDKDFATISSVLAELLNEKDNIQLFLVGPLTLPKELEKFGDRIEKVSYVPREKHFKNIASININLAPLEVTPFTESKSELKFFEAGILEVPTVASSVQTFQEAIEDGVDGFVAGNTEEWVEKLEKLITNKDLREKMGKMAKKKSLEKYTNKNSNSKEYYNYLRNI